MQERTVLDSKGNHKLTFYYLHESSKIMNVTYRQTESMLEPPLGSVVSGHLPHVD